MCAHAGLYAYLYVRCHNIPSHYTAFCFTVNIYCYNDYTVTLLLILKSMVEDFISIICLLKVLNIYSKHMLFWHHKKRCHQPQLCWISKQMDLILSLETIGRFKNGKMLLLYGKTPPHPEQGRKCTRSSGSKPFYDQNQ